MDMEKNLFRGIGWSKFFFVIPFLGRNSNESVIPKTKSFKAGCNVLIHIYAHDKLIRLSLIRKIQRKMQLKRTK